MSGINPKAKANQLKDHFEKECNLIGIESILAARAYIRQLLNDFNLKDGDYEILGYKHEWHEYTSYWNAVLKNLIL